MNLSLRALKRLLELAKEVQGSDLNLNSQGIILGVLAQQHRSDLLEYRREVSTADESDLITTILGPNPSF